MRTARGFTLLELLCAMVIFALMAAAAYRGMDVMLRSQARLEAVQGQWRDMDLLFRRLTQDLASALPRGVRGPDGRFAPAFDGAAGSLTLTRSWPDARAPLQRLGYRLDDGTVRLILWPADEAVQPESYDVVEHVRQLTFRYLAASGAWQDAWQASGVGQLPAAVQVRLTLEDGRVFTRLLALP